MSAQAGPLLTRRWAPLGEHILATIWTIWLMWPFIRLDRYVIGFDTIAYSGPNFAVDRRQWGAGHVPLWDSGIFGGTAHLANPTAGTLYPLKFLGYFFSTSRALGLLVALHMIILANGLVVLVSRRLGRRAPGGLVAAIAFTGSGMGMTKSIQFEQMLVLAWLPWLLVCLHGLFFAEQPRRWSVALAVCTAMTLLAGHPQIVYIEMPLIAVCCVVGAWTAGNLSRLKWVAAAGLLGALLASPQLLLSAQATSRASVSSAERLKEASQAGYSVNPARVAQTLFGDLRADNVSAAPGGFESTSVIGVSVLVLACIGAGVAIRRRRGPSRLLALTALIGLVLAFGPFTRVHRAAIKLIPGYSFARVPARWMIIPTFLAALAAAEAVNAVRDRRLSLRTFRVVVGLGVLAIVASLAGSVQTPGRRTFGTWFVIAALIAVATWVRPRFLAATLLTVVVVVELGMLNTHNFGRSLTSRTDIAGLIGPIPRYLADHPGRSLAITNDAAPTPYLLNGFRPNANNLVGARSIDGYDGGVQVTRRWLDGMAELAGAPLDPTVTLRGQIGGPLNVEAFGRFGVHYLLLESGRADASSLSSGWIGPVLTDGSIQVWENPRWVGDATVSDGTNVVAAALISRRDGHAVVSTSGAGGLLRLDEQFAPEWKVRIDGKSSPTVEVDRFSVGVHVPAGDHRVTFDYESRLFTVGAILAIVAAAALLSLWFYRGQKRL